MSSARQFGGTGLGLYLVRQLAEAMGGAVEVDSTLGEGTTFTVRLPLPVIGPRGGMQTLVAGSGVWKDPSPLPLAQNQTVTHTPT